MPETCTVAAPASRARASICIEYPVPPVWLSTITPSPASSGRSYGATSAECTASASTPASRSSHAPWWAACQLVPTPISSSRRPANRAAAASAGPPSASSRASSSGCDHSAVRIFGTLGTVDGRGVHRQRAGGLCHHRTVRRPATAVALLALTLAACGGGHASQGASATPTSGAPTTTDGEATAATGRAGWTTYGASPSRAGVAPGTPSAPKLRRRFARAVDGQVYAQPLIARGRIYVATENNSVYAFTTSGRLVWHRHLGAPVRGGDLPCGNIDPSGITSTPVIAGGRLFAVAFLRAGHRHVLFGLRLRDGGVAVQAGFDPPNPLVGQQRGALLAAPGRIYVPYGGLFGRCRPFR